MNCSGDGFATYVRSEAHLLKKTELSMVYANEKFKENNKSLCPWQLTYRVIFRAICVVDFAFADCYNKCRKAFH